MESMRMKRYSYTSSENGSSDNSDYDINPEDYNINGNDTVQKGAKHSFSSSMNDTFQHYRLYSKGDKINRLTGDNKFEKSRMLNDKRKKCYTKNALMARENRLKKKLYLENLERTVEKLRNDNRKLTSVVDDQTHIITNLKREIKYFKSVLANSNEIGKLLRCINQNTGMAVTTSIDKTMSLNEINTMHPWSEVKTFDNDLSAEPIEDTGSRLEDFLQINEKLEDTTNGVNVTEVEHNYTTKSPETDSDFGVCLHISHQKVSLEFCSICSEKATTAWEED